MLIPDAVIWNAAISAYEKCKQWEVATGLLQDMVYQLLASDVVT